MERYHVGCVPVLDEGKLVGIVTEFDFVKWARQYFERE
jgi:CBS domain-containing protein